MSEKVEGYLVVGKGIATEIHTSPSRKRFWLLPGGLVCKKEAKNMRSYRTKSWQLRQSAKQQNLLVDVGDFYLITETLVFNSVSDACSFVLGSSRSGNVAKRGRKALIGRNLIGAQLENCND